MKRNPHQLKTVRSLVAFVDLLGFSDKVKLADSSEKLADLKASVETIRSGFEHKPKDPEIRKDHKWSRKLVVAFSDCLIVAVNVDSHMKMLMGSFDALGDELLGFAYAQAECVARGYFISGGIDLGAWYYRDQIMISPAMVCAYEIQDKLWHPVLAVTDKLHEFFFNHAERKQYSPRADPTKFMFRELTDKGHTMRFLDYLELCLRSEIGWVANDAIRKEHDATRNPELRFEIIERGRALKRENFMKGHAASISKGATTCPERAKRKYKFLEAYHNQVVDDWFSGNPDLKVVL